MYIIISYRVLRTPIIHRLPILNIIITACNDIPFLNVLNDDNDDGSDL